MSETLEAVETRQDNTRKMSETSETLLVSSQGI